MKERTVGVLNGALNPVGIESAKAFEDRALRVLRDASYRITMPRVQVIRALADTKTALSAYAIHEKILEGNGKIDVVSVYRILNTLKSVGLIHHIGVADGFFPSRLVGPAGGSQHLVCDSCGNITEVPVAKETVGATRAQAKDADFSPSGIKVEITGKCAACAKK